MPRSITPIINVVIKGKPGPIGKTQLAHHLEKAVRSFDPKGVTLPRIAIRDDDNVLRIHPSQLRQNPHADLLASIEEAGKPYNIDGGILDCIAKANAGAADDRNDFALEMATQYGFTIIDDNGDIYGATAECLAGLMSVLGYRTGKERLAARAALEAKFPRVPFGETFEVKSATIAAFDDLFPHGHADRVELLRIADHAVQRVLKELDDKLNHLGGLAAFQKFAEAKTAPAETKTEHDSIDKLLYAYGQAASKVEIGDAFYELPEFKAVKGAFAKKTMAATIKIDTEHFVKDVGDFVADLERTKLGTYPIGGLVGSGESDFVVKVRKGYAGLHRILVEALDQAQSGKGAERHNMGGDIPFEEQRMQTISELIGSVDGMAYQACKKITEGVNLPTLDRQVRELLGAINYIAGMIVYLRKQDDGESHENKFAKYCAADLDPLQVSEFSRDMVRQMREAANPMPDVPYESARQALVEKAEELGLGDVIPKGGKMYWSAAHEVIANHNRIFGGNLFPSIAVPRHLLMPIGTVFPHDGSDVMTPRIGSATIVEVRFTESDKWSLPRLAREVAWKEVREWRMAAGWKGAPSDGRIPVALAGDFEARVEAIARNFPDHSFQARACEVHWYNVKLWRHVNPTETA